MSKFKISMMGFASALAISGPGAFAQDNSTDEETVLDEVVVQGIRGSLAKSIDVKRNADALVDVITATDIGKFPDKNVAESLQRVTGISIQREFGEGERVTIRGIASNRNLTTLNGHGIATADWFILDQLSATRSFNYLMLPSEIVSSVEVYKSGQADINEGGVGGVVDVKTRKPLDLKAFQANFSLQGAYPQLADEFTPQASGLLSWKNDSETFGILGALIFQERELRRDGLEVLGYTSNTIDDQGGASLQVPQLIGSALFEQTRERLGGNLVAQFRPNDQLDISLNLLHTEMEADNVNHNYMAWISQLSGSGVQPTNTTVGADGTLLAATYAQNPNANGVVYDAIVREALSKTTAYDLDLTYELADNMTLSGKIGFTEAEGSTERQPFWEVVAPTSVTYDLTSGVPQVSFGDIDPLSTSDAEQLVLGWASSNIVENFDEEFFMYGDVERRLDSGPFKDVTAGVKYTEHKRDVVVTYGQTRSLLSADGSPACGGEQCTLATVNRGRTPSDFLDGIGGGSGVLDGYLLADPDAVTSVYDQVDFGTDFPDFFHSGPLDSFTVKEDVFAAYVMGDFEQDRIRGNLGVRIVNTDQTVEGFAVGVDPATPGSFNNPFGRSVTTSTNTSYTDVLPSANLVFEMQENMLLRASASRVMARADYNQLAGSVNLASLLLSGNGGNPDLDPFRASAFDVGFEWYRGDDGLLSVALFYKDIESYITTSNFVERQPVSIEDPATDGRISNAGNNCVSTPSDIDPTLYTCDFNISRPVNGRGGTNQGFELSYQQALPNGFGFIANYTYSDAESDNGDPIPENSQHTANLTGYYENDRLSGRLSLNYRDEFFIGVDRGSNLYHKPITTIDGSLTWDINDTYSLTLEGVNLTEENIEQYYEVEGRPARLYDNGRIIYFGVKASF